MYSSYVLHRNGIMEKVSWVLAMTVQLHGNGIPNVIIFGVDNSSSSPVDNYNNNLLVLGEGDAFGINGIFGAPEKKFSINFCKANKILLEFTL